VPSDGPTEEGRDDVSGDADVIDLRDPYQQLLAIARIYGPDEIKHLTRAYQAIAPQGGGRIIDLTALLD
jgi:hypothetical protein